MKRWPPRQRVHLNTATGTPDLSGSVPCGSSRCRINPAFRLTSLSLCVVVVSRCARRLLLLLLTLFACHSGAAAELILPKAPTAEEKVFGAALKDAIKGDPFVLAEQLTFAAAILGAFYFVVGRKRPIAKGV